MLNPLIRNKTKRARSAEARHLDDIIFTVGLDALHGS